MAQVECIGPIKIAMKIRRDSIALAAEALSKMFDKGEEELVAQVSRIFITRGGVNFFRSSVVFVIDRIG